MTFRAVKDALHLREIAARVMGLERRVKEPLVRFDFANLVENGGFDVDANWSKGAGWTISGGVANLNTTTAGAGVVTELSQTATTIPDKLYSLRLNISTAANFTSNEVFLRVNDIILGDEITAPGNRIENFIASSVDTKIALKTGSLQDGNETLTTDNVSLWEADPADDAPWLRLPYGYSVGKTGMIVRDGLILHPSEYTEITRDGQTFIKPLVAPGHDTEFSIWAGVKT